MDWVCIRYACFVYCSSCRNFILYFSMDFHTSLIFITGKFNLVRAGQLFPVCRIFSLFVAGPIWKSDTHSSSNRKPRQFNYAKLMEWNKSCGDCLRKLSLPIPVRICKSRLQSSGDYSGSTHFFLALCSSLFRSMVISQAIQTSLLVQHAYSVLSCFKIFLFPIFMLTLGVWDAGIFRLTTWFRDYSKISLAAETTNA